MPTLNLNTLATIFASLTNQSLLNENVDDVVVFFVQDPNDVVDGELMTDKKVTDGCFSFCHGIR